MGEKIRLNNVENFNLRNLITKLRTTLHETRSNANEQALVLEAEFQIASMTRAAKLEEDLEKARVAKI
jgi:hypothetical protein